MACQRSPNSRCLRRLPAHRRRLTRLAAPPRVHRRDQDPARTGTQEMAGLHRRRHQPHRVHARRDTRADRRVRRRHRRRRATKADPSTPTRTRFAHQPAWTLTVSSGTVYRSTEAITVTTGYVYHPLFVWHDTGTSAGLLPANPPAGIQPAVHIENPEAKRRAHELIHACGLLAELTVIEPRRATMAELLRVHTSNHIHHIKTQSDLRGGGDAGDGFSPVGPGSYEIARLAAGGLIELVTAVARGEVTNGYALTRPPGHHATADLGMGFCLFNNLAIAARHAQAELGLPRIAIVDWDAHHGNGTQSIFYGDPSVLTISLHQAGCFPPDSGWIRENGAGDGTGYAINVPLPPGTGHAGYLHAMTEIVLPALERFAPDLIMLANGFDASVFDPMARQMLTADSYRAMTRMLTDAADRLCHGRLVAAHDGGYSPFYVPYCALAFLEELAGTTTRVTDPLAAVVADYAAEPLQPHQKAVIDEAAQLVSRIRQVAPQHPSAAGHSAPHGIPTATSARPACPQTR